MFIASNDKAGSTHTVLSIAGKQTKRQDCRTSLLPEERRTVKIARIACVIAASTISQAAASPFAQSQQAWDVKALRARPASHLYVRDDTSSDNSSEPAFPVQLILIIVGAVAVGAIVLSTILWLCRASQREWWMSGCCGQRRRRRNSWNVDTLPQTLPHQRSNDSLSFYDEKDVYEIYHGSAGFDVRPAPNAGAYSGKPTFGPMSRFSSGSDRTSHKEAAHQPEQLSNGFSDLQQRYPSQSPRWSGQNQDKRFSKSTTDTMPPARKPSFLERALARPASGQERRDTGTESKSTDKHCPQSDERLAFQPPFNWTVQQDALPLPVLVHEQAGDDVPMPQLPQAAATREFRRSPTGTIFSALGAPLHALRSLSQTQSGASSRSTSARRGSRRAWHSFYHSGASPRLFAIESDFEGTIGERDNELPMARPAKRRRSLCDESSMPASCAQFPQILQAPEVHSSADLYAQLPLSAKNGPRMPTDFAGVGASYRSRSDSIQQNARCDVEWHTLSRSQTQRRFASLQQQALNERVLEELRLRQADEEGNESSHDRRLRRAAKITSWVNANGLCNVGSPSSIASRRNSETSIALTTSEFISVSRQASIAHRNMVRRLQSSQRRGAPQQGSTQTISPEELQIALQEHKYSRVRESPLQPPPRISSYLDAPASWSCLPADDEAPRLEVFEEEEEGATVLPHDIRPTVAKAEEPGNASVAAAMSHVTAVANERSGQSPRSINYVRAPRDVWLAEHVKLEDDKRRLILEQRQRSRQALAATALVPEMDAHGDDDESEGPKTPKFDEEMSDVTPVNSPKIEAEPRNKARAPMMHHMELIDAHMASHDPQLRRQSTLMKVLRSDSMNRSLQEFKAPILVTPGTSANVSRKKSTMRCVSTPAAGAESVATAVQRQTPHPRMQAVLERARRASASIIMPLPPSSFAQPAGALTPILDTQESKYESPATVNVEEVIDSDSDSAPDINEDARRGSWSGSSESHYQGSRVSGPRPMPTMTRSRSISARLPAEMTKYDVTYGRGISANVSQASASSGSFRYSHLLY